MEEMFRLIRENSAKRVFVQVPEGLKTDIYAFAAFFAENGVDAIFSVEPCFGACDLRDRDAKLLGCDLLVHIGHADFGVKPDVKTIYYELRIDFDFTQIIEENKQALDRYKKIGLMTTVQFVHEAERIKAFLENMGKEVFLGKNKKSGYPAHVLGCDYTAVSEFIDDVDCLLYFGSGAFHPSGILIQKPILSVDMGSGRITDISENVRKLAIKRELSIEKARGMTNFAVYVSTKPGQMHTKAAMNAKRMLEEKGKHVVLISADMLTPEKLIGMKVDVIVNTACPRIREDAGLFGKIILNYEDVKRI
ncbi:MAG: diphthamide biosynthesis enzyme Dph2 [Candidatus Micrarchaeota archaeon]|nr:diphthamide biosynthesis enzyme Dph2 [Candidatus Micrarchaeota archaeon]